MAITSRGMSIQEAYRNYRDNKLIVNRQYQRKLVWSVDEKQMLIDSVLNRYPIPLILLAKSGKIGDALEIIDGMQRLNAIFGFIENEFSFNDKYFDVNQFPTAKITADEGHFTAKKDGIKALEIKLCAEFLDYNLAITQFDAESPQHVVSVFGRINSGGRQLSDQERRQAGVISQFANIIRTISSEIRGDATNETLLLSQMPSISIESKRATQKYGLIAQDIFWCKQGIISTRELIASDDEEIVADIAASILLKKPLAISREMLDNIYKVGSEDNKSIENSLISYTAEKLKSDIIRTFSVIKNLIENHPDNTNNFLRDLVRPGSNPIKTPFFSIFMAFYELVVVEQLTPNDPGTLFKSLKNSGKRLKYSAHYAKSADREANIQVINGLIRNAFVKEEPPIISHGGSLAIDFENSLRRSKSETAQYELKQGILDLGRKRGVDNGLLTRINETICAIANIGPHSKGYITFGVADSEADAQRISNLDNIHPIEISGRYVVGIDREASILKKSIDNYISIIINSIKCSRISEPLKSHVLASIDTISFRGHSIIRITIPSQAQVSLTNDKCFVRNGPNTVELVGLDKVLAVSKIFSK